MAYSSIDDFLKQVTVDKKYSRYHWTQRLPGAASVAGRWYNLSSFPGTPEANAFAGTSLNWVSCDDAAGNGTQVFGIQHGGNVANETKHVLNVSAVGLALGSAPAQLMLVDLQGYWPGISTNSTAVQTLSGTPTLRYSNGAGCRLFFVQTVAAGATAFNIETLTYTNQAGANNKTLPTSVAMTASAIVGHMSHSGVGGANFGPFLPLADGDTGIANVASIKFSRSSGAGSGALCLARPLLTLPLVSVATASERDLLNQLPSLPRVYDGACLVWLYYSATATTALSHIAGHIDFGWG